MKSRTLVAALAVSLVLAQSRLAPPALAQAQATTAPTPTATAQPPQAAATPQSQSPAPLDKRAEKIRREVRRRGLSQRITVIMPNEDDLHGTITQIGEQSFDLAEVDQRRIVTVPYAHVKKVRSGYRPHPDIFTGERNSPPIGMRIAAFAGLVFAVALPLIVLGSAKE